MPMRGPAARAAGEDDSCCRTRRSMSTTIRLADWPKPASLLPRAQALAGRGRVRRSSISRGASAASRWRRSDRIISTSTFSPMTARFRSIDAYRVELGVDAGAGPRRFTLFFIPPRTKLHDHPEMAALLCAGLGATGDNGGLHRGRRRQGRLFRRRPAPHHGRNDHSVVGARHRGAGSGTQLRAEIAVTSWHRERWMSLSGRPPRQAMADPSGWRADAARRRPAMIARAGPG